MASKEEKTFLQSWNWGEFNRAQGSKIWRLGIFNDGSLWGAALVIKVKARRGTFLFVPQGPIFDKNFQFSIFNFQFLINYLKGLALDEGCDFIRISPALDRSEKNQKLFQGIGFRRAPIHMHAELMWILDIAPKEEKLLKDMRKTARYSIRKAERDGVKIIKSLEPNDVLRFNKIYKETAERHSFTPYSLGYLQKEFECFAKDDQAMIFLAEYNGEIVAAAMIIFYGSSAFYHHGASSSKHGEVPSAYLLQWEAIREAKNRGCKIYNFWGIAGADPPVGGHPWAGLTLFKKGFGGFSKEYLPAQDLPLRPQYWLSFIVEKIRKAKRHL